MHKASPQFEVLSTVCGATMTTRQLGGTLRGKEVTENSMELTTVVSA